MADILGLLADAITGGVDWMRDPRRTQQMQGIGGLLADTLASASRHKGLMGQEAAYTQQAMKAGRLTDALRGGPAGEELTQAVANAYNPAGMAMPIGRAAMAGVRATKGLPVGAGVRQVNLSEDLFKPELTMQEMLKVKDIPTVQRMQRSMDLVGEKEFEKMVNAQFKKYKPTDPEQEAMLVESVTLDILGRANRDPDLLKGLISP